MRRHFQLRGAFFGFVKAIRDHIVQCAFQAGVRLVDTCADLVFVVAMFFSFPERLVATRTGCREHLQRAMAR